MKQEETDRFIRQQLEELENVPDLNWNADAAWKKIRFRLDYGMWMYAGFLSVVVAALVGTYLFWPEQKPPSMKTPQVEVQAPLQKPVPQKVISVPEKKVKKIPAIKPSPQQQTVSVRRSLLRPIRFDAHLERLYPGFIGHKINDKKYAEITELHQNVDLRMPPLRMVHVDINNSFNLNNLFRTIEAGNDPHVYYRYQYNNRYAPASYRDSYMQSQSRYIQIKQYP